MACQKFGISRQYESAEETQRSRSTVRSARSRSSRCDCPGAGVRSAEDWNERQHHCMWHETDIPNLLSDVRCWGQSGKHLLAASISSILVRRTQTLVAVRLILAAFASISRFRDRAENALAGMPFPTISWQGVSDAFAACGGPRRWSVVHQAK